MPAHSRPRGLVAALAWVGAAAITGTVAWNAVAVLSDDGPRTGLMSQSEVSAALVDARASASASATATTAATTDPPSAEPADSPQPGDAPTDRPTGDPTTPAPEPAATTAAPTTGPTRTSSPAPSASSSPTAPAPKAVAATWHVTGGTVSVECTGSRISLLYATPDDGWTVEVGSRGPEKVEVELHGSAGETKLVARCSDGTPTRTIESSDEDHGDDDEHEDD